MEHNVLHTLIESVLVCSYAFVLFIIITSRVKVLKTAFYVIFVATGVADLFAIFASCFNRLNRQLGLGPEFKTLVSFVINLVSMDTFLSTLIEENMFSHQSITALCSEEVMTSGNSRISGHEKGLLFYTALVFVSTMMMCLQQVLKAIATLSNNTDLDLWATMQFFWINDVMVCVPPASLVMLSADLRQDIANFFRCRRHRSKSLASVSVLNKSTIVK
ncbi:hypothetical protein OSTOST_07482 [Ostertagia ostertagi]